MAVKMTTKERMTRMINHQEADRVPIYDYPWRATEERWVKEGMPEGADWIDFFDLDKIAEFKVDGSPRFPEVDIEKTPEYTIYTTNWGATQKTWTHMDSTPEFLKFTVVDPDSWREVKKRITPTKDRIDWARLQENYATWRKDGAWLNAAFWFGFDITHAGIVGTERFLMALLEEPEWCVEMFNHELDMNIALFEMILEAGYEFDGMRWWDDMGYKKSQFFSLKTYRELLKPVHQRAIDWAHQKGMKVFLHSCGDVNPFVPELVAMGVDVLNPLEVKAGMDPVALKQKYGQKLTFHGGINAVLWDRPEAMQAEIRKIVPAMKQNGGYIYATDHSIPPLVSLKDFKATMDVVKEAGKY